MWWDCAWAWLNANSGAVEAAATVLAALIAAGALLSAAYDSRSRSRPLVAAEHRLAPHSDTSIQLLIKNYGQSAARSVKVQFNPDLPDDKDTRDVRLRYGSVISWLNPGQELVNTWLIPRYESNNYAGNVYSFPDRVTVTLTYWGGWIKYRTDVDLDVELYIRSSSSVSSTSMLGSMQGIRQDMKHLVAATKAIGNKMPATTEGAQSLAGRLAQMFRLLGQRLFR